jgi:hypothetical protein
VNDLQLHAASSSRAVRSGRRRPPVGSDAVLQELTVALVNAERAIAQGIGTRRAREALTAKKLAERTHEGIRLAHELIALERERDEVFERRWRGRLSLIWGSLGIGIATAAAIDGLARHSAPQVALSASVALTQGALVPYIHWLRQRAPSGTGESAAPQEPHEISQELSPKNR